MSLTERLGTGETLLTAWSSIPDPLTVELLAATAFDAVTLDMQHGGHHEDSVLRSAPAVINAGKPFIVRIPVGRFDMASRALDFGADAVIAPMINTLEDAQAFANAMKYPPVGGRSWGPSLALQRKQIGSSQTYLETANSTTLALAMIETREALAIVDDILGLEGIDGVFVGPSDFSIAWTGGQHIDPKNADMADAIASIAEKAASAGKLAAIFAADPVQCGPFETMGYRLIAVQTDVSCLLRGAQVLIDEARSDMAPL